MKLSHRLWRLGRAVRSIKANAPRVGDVFPSFSLQDTDGHRHALIDASPGIFTILWLTNLCEDCRSKIPLLNQLKQEVEGRFRVLAISLLGQDDLIPREVQGQCKFPILLDPDDLVGTIWGLPHPPSTCPLNNFFILDEKRHILFRHHLSALSPKGFRSILEKIEFQGMRR